MSSSILIPVQGSDEVVEVHVDELPEDVNDVIDILQAEMAPLDLWLRFAVEYYKQGLTDHFKMLLKPLLELAEAKADQSNRYENMLFEQFHTDPNAKPQFVAILNALASCHLATASRERDKSKRKAGFEQAKKYFNSAQKIDLLNSGSMVGEAVLLLAQGDLDRASSKLESAADYCRGNVPVLLAKACAKFQGGAVEEARRLYREVFALNPSPPPAVRLGLAYTSARLGQHATARKAFERVLELNPDCVEALAGLGVLECNEGRVEAGMARLGQAHALEPSHPIVLNRLADHFFLRGEYDQAKSLAQRAFRQSTSPSVRAEAAYHIGRVFHAQIDFSSALQWYSQASKEAPTFLPPHYGLGQMHLVNNDRKRALECFEKILNADADNVDALKLAGMLYAQMDRKALATERLSRATELAPNDVMAWLELAKVHESTPALAVALSAYEKAAAILKRAGRRVPVALWNNLGALRQRLGKLASAEQAYQAALRLCKSDDATPIADMHSVTVSFNLGRLWEQMGKVPAAVEQYTSLLLQHPNYIDAFVRLAACERVAGRLQGAEAWLKKGLEVAPLHEDLWCSLGNVHIARGEWALADGCFKRVLEKCEGCNKDAYAMLSLANIQVHLASAKRRSPKDEHAYLDKATELYRSVLGQQPNNAYAANGLGVVCAKKGRLVEARSIFTAVRDASSECDAALVNLGQIHAAQREPQAALGLYQKAERRAASAPAASLLALQARAHFDAGALGDARRVLARALHQRPYDLSVRFNLATVLYRAAKPPRDGALRSIPDLDAAAAGVRLAVSHLDSIREAGEQAREAAAAGGLSVNRVSALRSRCVGLQGAVGEERREAWDKAQAQEVAQKIADERLAALAAEKAARQASELAAKRFAEEEEARLIREQKAALEAKLTVWKEAEAKAAEAAAKAKGRKRRAGDGRPLGELDSDSDDVPPAPAPAEAEEREADEALFGSDDSDGEEPVEPTPAGEGEPAAAASGGRLKKASGEVAEAGAPDEEMRDIFGDEGGDGEADGGGDGEASGEGGGARKKRRVLDDEDE